MVTRPEIVKDEHLKYLDDLRDMGTTNMFGAAPYLQGRFGLGRWEAKDVLLYWMASFNARKGEGA